MKRITGIVTVLLIWLNHIALATDHHSNTDDEAVNNNSPSSSSDRHFSKTTVPTLYTPIYEDAFRIPKRRPKIPKLPKLPRIPVPQFWKIPQMVEFLKRHKSSAFCGGWNSWPCAHIAHNPALIGGCFTLIIGMCLKGRMDTVYDCTLSCAKSINTGPNFGNKQLPP